MFKCIPLYMNNTMFFIYLFILSLVHFSQEIKPNVLFIVIDDLRPFLGAYGYKNAFTPNIDILAKKSIVFNNAYCQQAVCAPSRNSFLTSRRPDSTKLYDFYSYWRDVAGNFTTLPQHFKENGYHTYSIGKVFHPGISSNFTDDYEYSWSDFPYHPPTEQFKEAKNCPTKNGKLAKNLVCPVIPKYQPGGTLPDIQSVTNAIEFLKNYDNSVYSTKPYFLAVGLHKPHVPLRFPVNYLDFHSLENITLPTNRERPSLLPTVAWSPWIDVRRRDDIKKLNLSFPFGLMPDFMTKKIIQSYNAATSYVDDLIGQLLKHTHKNTIVVLIGDHGWSLSEHGEFSKFSNFEVTTRVPFIIHVPKLTTNNKKMIMTNSLVELVDIFPTLVDLTKITESLNTCTGDNNIKLCTEGRSLVPLIISTVQNQKYRGKSAVFSQYPRPGVFPTQKPDSDVPHLKDIKIMGYTMRTEHYRYTEWIRFNHKKFIPNWLKVYGRELYDHTIDPDENFNLAEKDEMQKIVKNLSHKLRLGWRYVA